MLVLDKVIKVEFYPEYTPFQNPIPKHCTSMQKVEMIRFSATIFPPLFRISTKLKISKKHIVKNDAKCCDEQRILCRPIWNTLFYEKLLWTSKQNTTLWITWWKQEWNRTKKIPPFSYDENQTIIKNYYC